MRNGVIRRTTESRSARVGCWWEAWGLPPLLAQIPSWCLGTLLWNVLPGLPIDVDLGHSNFPCSLAVDYPPIFTARFCSSLDLWQLLFWSGPFLCSTFSVFITYRQQQFFLCWMIGSFSFAGTSLWVAASSSGRTKPSSYLSAVVHSIQTALWKWPPTPSPSKTAVAAARGSHHPALKEILLPRPHPSADFE